MGTPGKIDFQKEYKQLFSANAKEVTEVSVPPLPFLMVDGAGDPNGQEFQDAVGALYSVAYTIKFWAKKHPAPAGYRDFGVAPLEGLWWLKGGDIGVSWYEVPRESWRWTAMIMQPDFITETFLKEVIAEVAAKKPNPKLFSVRLETLTEGQCVQIMHVGPYATEMDDIKKLVDYIDEHGLKSNGKHHEIYLGDPRRTAPEKLKTILRHPVTKAQL